MPCQMGWWSFVTPISLRAVKTSITINSLVKFSKLNHLVKKKTHPLICHKLNISLCFGLCPAVIDLPGCL
jgi:hypothetical protein